MADKCMQRAVVGESFETQNFKTAIFIVLS